MNFTLRNVAVSLGSLTAAIAISATLHTAPVQALTLTLGDRLELNGVDNVFISNAALDFGLNGPADGVVSFDAANSSSVFATELSGLGTINDLSLPPTPTQTNNFLTLFRFGPSLFFNITEFLLPPTITATPFGNAYSFAFRGLFGGINVNGALAGEGQILALLPRGRTEGQAFYTVSVTAIPTPALLPGLAALGLAAWRKRKADAMDEAES